MGRPVLIDLLFLSSNRLEFTKAVMANLLLNTDWNQVSRILLYDDNSEDGTREYLRALEYPVPADFRNRTFGSPVKVMNHYLDEDPAEMFAKIDSDTMVPKFWLEECMRVMHIHSDLDLLGIEAFRPVDVSSGAHRGYDDAQFIGGIGLMRTRAFADSLPRPNGRFGFTRWQESKPDVKKGWLNPALPVFLLDWLPREPWRSLTNQYVAAGWNRDWNAIFPEQCPYPEVRKDLWSWWCE